jgi:drug/metabolite transporter (DMT)-like permease
MLMAGLLHAVWHGLVKGGADQTINLAGMGIVAAVAAMAALPFVPAPPAFIWPALAVSVALHAGYKVCLARAYRMGDLAHAFPLARGTVPLFATAISFVALNQVPDAKQAIGIGLVSIGILALTFETLKGPINRHLLTATFGAGLAVACYSVLDAYGTRAYGEWAGFTAWLIVIDSMCFLVISWGLRGNDLWIGLVRMRWRIVTSGLLGVASFGVFLWALSRNPVGSVSAVRETSILFAILIGSLIYREPMSARRLAGGLIVIAGIFTIALGR